MEKPSNNLRTWLFAASMTAALGFGGSQALAAPEAETGSRSCVGKTSAAACGECCAAEGATSFVFRAPNTCICGYSPAPPPPPPPPPPAL